MKKRTDFGVVVLILLAASGTMLLFDLKPLWGGLLAMLVPALYLSIRSPKPWKAILGASITLGFLLGFFFDFIQSYNLAWSVDRLVIPWKVLGIMPIDNAIGYFLMTLFTLVFYEHFFAQRDVVHLPKRFYKVTALVASILIATLGVAIVDISLLTIPYTYAVGGVAAVVLTMIAAVRHLELLNALTGTSLFFFFAWFLVELVAVATGGWSYPGSQYLGWVSIGDIRFPIEELLFWMIWYAPFLVLGYEYLIRNKTRSESSAT